MKTGQWYHGGMARPVGLDVDTGSDASSIKTDTSPPHEKKARFPSQQQQQQRLLEGDGGEGSEKENRGQNAQGRHDGKPGGITRAGSLHGKELKRQYSMSDAMRAKGSGALDHQGGGGGGDAERRRAPGERGRSTGRETSRSRAVSEQRGSERENAWRAEERAARERPRSRGEPPHEGAYPPDTAEGRGGGGERHGGATRQYDRTEPYHGDDRHRTDVADRGRSRDARIAENRHPPREPSPQVTGGPVDDRVRAPSREKHGNREGSRRRDESRHR